MQNLTLDTDLTVFAGQKRGENGSLSVRAIVKITL